MNWGIERKSGYIAGIGIIGMNCGIIYACMG